MVLKNSNAFSCFIHFHIAISIMHCNVCTLHNVLPCPWILAMYIKCVAKPHTRLHANFLFSLLSFFETLLHWMERFRLMWTCNWKYSLAKKVKESLNEYGVYYTSPPFTTAFIAHHHFFCCFSAHCLILSAQQGFWYEHIYYKKLISKEK